MVTAEFPGPSPQDLICSLLPFPSPSPPSVLQGLLTLPLFSGCEPVIIDLAHALAASDTHTHTHRARTRTTTCPALARTHPCPERADTPTTPTTASSPHLCPRPGPASVRTALAPHSAFPPPVLLGASLCLLHALRKLLPTAPQPLWVAHSHTLIPSPHLPWKSVF